MAWIGRCASRVDRVGDRAGEHVVDDRHECLGHRCDRAVRSDGRRPRRRRALGSPVDRRMGCATCTAGVHLARLRARARARRHVVARLTTRAGHRLGDPRSARHRRRVDRHRGWRRLGAPLVAGTIMVAGTVLLSAGARLAAAPTWAWIALGGTGLLVLAALVERSEHPLFPVGRRAEEQTSLVEQFCRTFR